jgi:putative copper resistance protein D
MAAMASPRARLAGAALAAAGAGRLVLPDSVAAHGETPDSAPTALGLLLDWTFPPIPTLALVVTALWWAWAVRRVNAVHPSNPVPRRRSIAFGGGLLAIGFALLSGIERYDTTLFSVHMVQHLLLTMVAAPLIALGAPITLVLRVVGPETRHRIVLPVLKSRLVRFVSFPVVAWVVFAAVMWASHFSPLFDAALEDPLLHDVEHGLFLGSALLFWWPAVGADPSPWRMSHPVRALYTFLQMPQNTFLAVILLSATTPLYPHYATLDRPWLGSALDDQRLAAGIMWLGGDFLFIAAVAAIVWGWMRAEEAGTVRADRRADAERAAIRAREVALAERRSEGAGPIEG